MNPRAALSAQVKWEFGEVKRTDNKDHSYLVPEPSTPNLRQRFPKEKAFPGLFLRTFADSVLFAEDGALVTFAGRSLQEARAHIAVFQT